MEFNKPPLSFDDQIELLRARGMVIADEPFARQHLGHINYYRLRAYWLPFEEPHKGHEHVFVPGTAFEDVLSIYIFDRQLRLLLLDAIERVELSLRTRWAYTLAIRYGAHAHLQPDIFHNEGKYQRCLQALREEIGRSRETFINHYQNKDKTPELPPIWAACEVMSLGQLSKWLENLKHRQDRRAIADAYGLDEKVVRSFMHHLTHIRNLCAHHSRVWNRKFTVTMQIPSRPMRIAPWFNRTEERRIYNTLTMLGHVLSVISPRSTWVTHVKQLMAAHLQARPDAMGFPPDWENIPLWKNAT